MQRKEKAKEIEHLHHWLHTVMLRSGRNPAKGTEGYPNRLDLVYKKYITYLVEELGLVGPSLPTFRKYLKALRYQTTFITTAKFQRVTVVMLRGYMIPPAITFQIYKKKKVKDLTQETEEWHLKTNKPTLSGNWDTLRQIINQYIKR